MAKSGTILKVVIRDEDNFQQYIFIYDLEKFILTLPVKLCILSTTVLP
jgi:hypothetical protein